MIRDILKWWFYEMTSFYYYLLGFWKNDILNFGSVVYVIIIYANL